MIFGELMPWTDSEVTSGPRKFGVWVYERLMLWDDLGNWEF